MPGAERELAGLLASVGGHTPNRVEVPVPAGFGRLQSEHREPSVGREAYVGRNAQAVQVVGLYRPRRRALAAGNAGCSGYGHEASVVSP
jgi:hypothetical protein